MADDLENLENALKRINFEMPNKADAVMTKMAKKVRLIGKNNTPIGKKNKPVRKHMKNRWSATKSRRIVSLDVFIAEVKNKAPHAHLLEDGHYKLDGGFVQGKHILKKTLSEFDDQVEEILDDLIDDVLKELK